MSLEKENERLRDELEYAYRCIEHGYVHGTFDFSVLRTRASNYLAELGCKKIHRAAVG